jgi:hypothetical protein
MDDSSTSAINSTSINPVKRCWNVGANTVVVIDKSIVQKLGINENNTLLEEEITPDGILLKIRKISNQDLNI